MRRTKRTHYQPRRKGKGTKTGPKSKCTPEVVEQAYGFCLLGLTNWQLAKQFGVTESSIEHWYRTREDFRQAVDEGRLHSGVDVVKMMFARAMGFSHPAVKIFMDRRTEEEYDEEGNLVRKKSYGVPVKVDYMEYWPPDVKAQTKILNSRFREQWNDMIKVQHEHQHLFAGDINIHHVLEQITDSSDFTDEELKLAAKIGLDRLLKEQSVGEN